MEHLNGRVIIKYVRSTLNPEITENRASEFEEHIVQKASGVFLWVVLVIEMLLSALRVGEPMKQMQQKLHDIPPELDDLFVQILDKIAIENLPMTMKLMQLVLLAERPLMPIELTCALGYTVEDFSGDEQRERFIRSQSQGLIEVEREQIDEN